MLGSASYLRLCLACTYGTPVENMLAHLPSLPLVIDYFQGMAAEGVDGILLALGRRDRVRCIRFRMPVRYLQNLIVAIDNEYPALEYLIMAPSSEVESTALMLPETFQAPHLRHLVLRGFALPIGSRLLTTAAGLVTLSLAVGHPSSYFQPNFLLEWLSFMPQLEKLLIVISYPVPDSDVESQLTHTPITTTITLPNLRCFEFQGSSSYMEAVVRWVTTPRLEKLGIGFFEQLTYSLPSILQLMNTSENLRFDSAKFKFSRYQVDVVVYLGEKAEDNAFSITIYSWNIIWQVSSVAQVFNSLSQMGQVFSTAEHLILEHEKLFQEHDEVDRAEWRKLLRPFRNVKTLRVDDGFVMDLCRSLRPGDGEHPLEVLPRLEELTYSGSGDTGDAFTSFIDVRQNAGRPVTLVRL
jgi:hypothetical protein